MKLEDVTAMIEKSSRVGSRDFLCGHGLYAFADMIIMREREEIIQMIFIAMSQNNNASIELAEKDDTVSQLVVSGALLQCEKIIEMIRRRGEKK